jgi:hypothetical protein
LFIILISFLLLERGGGKVAVGCAAVEMSSSKVLGKEREQNGLQRAAPCVCHAKFQHDISIGSRIDESCVNTCVERKLTGFGGRHGLEGNDGKVTGCSPPRSPADLAERHVTERLAFARCYALIHLPSRAQSNVSKVKIHCAYRFSYQAAATRENFHPHSFWH